jgi:uncharacterized protein (UPF0371 family)
VISKVGFDNEKYLQKQTEFILQRVDRYHGKLFLEFGGKLMFDYHAARVLPGYDPNVKIRLLEGLRDRAEIILCIYAGDIEKRKMRGDFGITYDCDALKLIDDLRARDIFVRGVVITRFEEQPSAISFQKRLEQRGIQVFRHYYTKGYPTDVDLIVSDKGYGRNEYIETDKPLVVVTGPGPGSGKLSTCLSQLYHDHRRGFLSGYSKFETFPIWNLPLKHPVNAAYEAATADLRDVNLLDPFHLEAYGKAAVNYNRDVDAFPLLRRILTRITGAESPWASPTDMGVNMAGFAITDDDAVREASRQEIVRRFFRYSREFAMGLADRETVQKVELLMSNFDISPGYRAVVDPARQAVSSLSNIEDCDFRVGAAIQLPDGSIETGKSSGLMHASAALVLNAVKKIAGIPAKTHLLSPETIDSVMNLKRSLGSANLDLDLEEALIALSISATGNPEAHRAMTSLTSFRSCEVHLTHIPSTGDEAGLRSLGVNLTCDPRFPSSNLFSG